MKRVLIALIMSTALFGTSAFANLITNGSFEQLPNALSNGSWTTYSSIPGWTALYGGIEVRNNVAGVAQDGNIFVELDAYYNSTMVSQPITTNPGEMYVLSYYYAPRPGVSAESNGIEFYFNNVKIDSVTGYSNLNNAWSLRSFTIMGTGSDVIKFSAVGISESLGGSIDNVSMTASSVPEPASLFLLGSGLGIIGLAALRRRK